MIPTQAHRVPVNPHHHQKNQFLLSLAGTNDHHTRDPIMTKLQSPQVNSLQGATNNKTQLLLSSLSQFTGRLDVSPETLLQTIDPTYGTSSGADGTGVETMAWDEFDTQGNDMMQKVYEDRLKKIQQNDAANNNNNNQVQPVANNLNLSRGSTITPAPQVPQRGMPPGRGMAAVDLDIDSDDSDFGEQIKAQKKNNGKRNSQNKRNSQIQMQNNIRKSILPTRGVPIGGTLPPGMTILDLDSSDDDFGPNVNNNTQNSKNNVQKMPSVASLQKGPKVISMSYKPDYATPLAQSMMGGPSAMMFKNDFGGFGDVVEEGDENEGENEDEEFDEDSDFGPIPVKKNIQQNQNSTSRPQLPPRPPLDSPKSESPPPPPPPPLDSPTNGMARPPRPVFGAGATGAATTTTTPNPPTTTTGRLSILDKAKFGAAGGAGGATGTAGAAAGGSNASTPLVVTTSDIPIDRIPTTTGRMSLWDKAKASGAGAGGASGAPGTTVKPTTTLPVIPQENVKNITNTTTNSTNQTTTNINTTLSTTASNVSNETEDKAIVFSFVPVPIIVPTSATQTKTSFLGQQLHDTGFLRNYQRTKGDKPSNFSFNGNTNRNNNQNSPNKRVGPTKLVKIRFKFNNNPLTVSIQTSATVEEFIQQCLIDYSEGNNTPELPSRSDKDYNLYMWDEDEDDIDDDIPPFNRNQTMQQLDSTSLCIVPVKNMKFDKLKQLDLYDESTRIAASNNNNNNNGMNNNYRNNNHDDIDNDCADNFAADITSPRQFASPTYQRDLSSLDLTTNSSISSSNNPNSISSSNNNTNNSISSNNNNNATGNNSNTSSLVNSANSDSVLAQIAATVSEDTLTTLDSVSAYIHQLYGVMTPAIAGKPAQYKTVKINEKGKRQERYFGLDRYNIYNKTTPSSAFNTFSKLLNISKTERPIKSIIHVRVLPEALTTFEIDYKEDGSDTITTRGYDVENVMICAEIVAKLRFLINNP